MCTKTKILLISFFVISSQAHENCPNAPPPRKNIDPANYMGTWYFIKSGPNHITYPNDEECTEETYTQHPHNDHLIDYEFKRLRSNVWEGGKGIGIVRDLENPGIIDIYDNESIMHQRIVGTDGNNWAIWYICEEIPDVTEPHEYYMLTSRKREINENVEEALTNIIDGFGIKMENLVKNNQTNCGSAEIK